MRRRIAWLGCGVAVVMAGGCGLGGRQATVRPSLDSAGTPIVLSPSKSPPQVFQVPYCEGAVEQYTTSGYTVIGTTFETLRGELDLSTFKKAGQQAGAEMVLVQSDMVHEGTRSQSTNISINQQAGIGNQMNSNNRGPIDSFLDSRERGQAIRLAEPVYEYRVAYLARLARK